MNKVISILKKFIARDKILHISAGANVTFVFGLIFSPLYGILAGILAGVIKEGLDALGFGVPDFYDFIATTIGAVGAGLFLLIV